MTDSETIRRILSPSHAATAQVLRDLSVIHRMEMLLGKLGRQPRPPLQFGGAGRQPSRGNTGCL
ncbi:MAG: hypothetical protein HLUCCA05_04620 [Roseibaca calidilacus]|uniref:Uncharacterized protein n=1 Tax=Roseibaca calidilacus TaxID=1666912 RepID=A0A0N8K743_9RHOB|nr:MAG: hypothetical protein HLUCCA05_04620 [Roseibaca calidilacus]CUX83406.1 hypothetical protein Ga0058931_2964 [Roseibaca calidilacus]